jgi:hypothetical protein
MAVVFLSAVSATSITATAGLGGLANLAWAIGLPALAALAVDDRPQAWIVTALLLSCARQPPSS